MFTGEALPCFAMHLRCNDLGPKVGQAFHNSCKEAGGYTELLFSLRGRITDGQNDIGDCHLMSLLRLMPTPLLQNRDVVSSPNSTSSNTQPTAQSTSFPIRPPPLNSRTEKSAKQREAPNQPPPRHADISDRPVTAILPARFCGESLGPFMASSSFLPQPKSPQA